jgi:hypothetical protein
MVRLLLRRDCIHDLRAIHDLLGSMSKSPGSSAGFGALPMTGFAGGLASNSDGGAGLSTMGLGVSRKSLSRGDSTMGLWLWDVECV